MTSTRPVARAMQLLRQISGTRLWGRSLVLPLPLPTRSSQPGGLRTLSTEANFEQDQGDAELVNLDVRNARAVPVSPSYFSNTPRFNDRIVILQKLAYQHRHLPKVPEHLAHLNRATFQTLDTYRAESSEPVNARAFWQAMQYVRRLHEIYPSLMPEDVKEAVEPFTRQIAPYVDVTLKIPIDQYGRAVGVGRRKTSTARAWIMEGTGEVMINGKTLAEAFGRIHDRESAIWPLRVTERMDKYNVWALVEGGGTTGQAEAMTLAVAKGLMAHEPDLKPALRRAGCVTRDRREVERKKHGHVKARKMPAWNRR